MGCERSDAFLTVKRVKIFPFEGSKRIEKKEREGGWGKREQTVGF